VKTQGSMIGRRDSRVDQEAGPDSSPRSGAPASAPSCEQRVTMPVPTGDPGARITNDESPDIVDSSWSVPPSSGASPFVSFSRMPTRHPSAQPTRPVKASASQRSSHQDDAADGASEQAADSASEPSSARRAP
jgi:hypothetical protein